MNKTILVISILIVVLIFGYFVWPTPYLYTHTAQNILVRINRITGESHYFLPGGGWKKIIEKKNSTENDAPKEYDPKWLTGEEEEEEKEYSSGFKPLD
jgi:hypothetical protein